MYLQNIQKQPKQDIWILCVLRELQRPVENHHLHNFTDFCYLKKYFYFKFRVSIYCAVLNSRELHRTELKYSAGHFAVQEALIKNIFLQKTYRKSLIIVKIGCYVHPQKKSVLKIYWPNIFYSSHQGEKLKCFMSIYSMTILYKNIILYTALLFKFGYFS